MAIARYPSFVMDCPDAGAMATFYAALLDWKPDISAGWANVRPADGSNCISFQQVENYTPPQWPDQRVPQQMHLDVVVDDLDAGEAAVLALGATQARVPAGHHLPRLPRPGGPPVLPVRGLTPQPAGARPARPPSADRDRAATRCLPLGDGHRPMAT